jgi:hypothetical protein
MICRACDYTEIRRSFEVPEENVRRLADKIAKLARKAAKLGCPAPMFAVVGEPFEKQRKTEDGHKYFVTYRHVEVSGESPQINGWRFAATVDHDGEENILRAIIDGAPARYRSARADCEHCKTHRRRSETFLLLSETGEWRQVGRQCLKDFLGHADPTSLAACAEWLAEAMEEAEECESLEGGSRIGDPAIERYLAYVACVIRLDGWKSRKSVEFSDGLCTSVAAALWMNDKSGKAPKPEEKDHETAEAAIEWARGIADDASDFDLNLRAASKRSGVSQKNAGITAYLVAGYLKCKTERKDKVESQHVGEVGKRFGSGKGKKAIPALRVTVERVIPSEGAYGTTYITTMRDVAGNVVKWFASGTCLETGEQYDVSGTVKSHGDYKGTRETVLSRCTAVKVPEAAEAAPEEPDADERDATMLMLDEYNI